MHCPILPALRRHETGGVWCFLLLLLLVAGERRLAEAHFNLRAWAMAIESADALDGDEIRVRLIVLNDDKPPSLVDSGRLLVSEITLAATARLDRVPLGRPAPRGPPAPASSWASS